MAIERRSFRLGLIAGLFLVSGIIVGIMLTVRMQWMPSAQSGISVSTPAAAAVALNAPQSNFVPVVKAAAPAVVNISTTRVVQSSGGQFQSPFMDDPFFRHFFGDEFSRRFNGPRKREESSLGSGVIVDSAGYIVTNNHVIAQADEIKVLLSDEREFTGKVVGTDPKTDLAVIKIDAKNLPTVPWGDSNSLEVGEYVLAVGNPFGLNQTITMGIVSAVGRANVGIADYEDFIQTDAAINPGNSGGALVNTRGELVGINTAIFSRSGGYMGIGFAVPANMARSVMESLIKTGKVVRGWLGVSIQKVTTDLAKQFDLSDAKGALVSEVIDNSPAAKHGIKSGDVIVAFDGKPVDNPTVLRNIVAATDVGRKVKVNVVRDGKQKTLTVKIAEQPKDLARLDEEEGAKSEGVNSSLAGLEVSNITPELARRLKVPEDTTGVVVTSVEPGTAAHSAGVKRGDVIIEVNRRRIGSVKDFRDVTGKLKKKESILLRINRQGGKIFIVIKP